MFFFYLIKYLINKGKLRHNQIVNNADNIVIIILVNFLK